MTRIVFPYGIRFREDRRVEIFPAAELAVIGRGTRGIRATFHIDSGAIVTVLPAADAQALGLRLESGKHAHVRGISGDVLNGYQHLITVQVGDRKLKIPAIFVDHVSIPRILGREGIFPRFGIVFDERSAPLYFWTAKVKEESSTLFVLRKHRKFHTSTWRRFNLYPVDISSFSSCSHATI